MKNKKIFILTTVLIIFLFIVAFLLSPFFAIKNIRIEGIENANEQTIHKLSGIEQGDNVFLINTFNAKKNISKYAYIEDVSFNRILPNTLVINIKEKKLCGFIPYMNKYLYVDGEGRVLDVQDEVKKNLPVMIGLDFTNFNMGEIIEVKNKNTFDILVELSNIMEENNLLAKQIKVDLSNEDEIMLYIDNIIVKFGGFADVSQKFSMLNEIISQLDKEGKTKGELDISDINKNPVFKQLG